MLINDKEKTVVSDSINVSDEKKEIRGLIFDIQGHSVHDGPGTRTTVFLAGCPLSCTWCCNPEGLFTHPIMMYSASKCVSCGRCISACPYDAITISEEGKVIHDRNKCDKCKTFECIQACYYEATSRSGKYYTVDELMRVFKRDRQFWGAKGGVTFSGGEPLMQKKFVSKVIKECKKSFIHVTVETTSCIAHDYYMDIMNYIDWVFTDIKHMDPVEHKRLTGVDNSLILKNIEALAKKEDWEGFVVPRIPVINNFNDSEENIRETAKFVKRIGLELINLLPFHRLGESKYRQIGRVYSFAEEVPPKKEKMIRLKKVVEEEGLYCFVGYETPF